MRDIVRVYLFFIIYYQLLFFYYVVEQFEFQ